MAKPKNPPGQTVKISTEAWYAEVVGDPDEPMPERLVGRRAEILNAMENGGPEAIRALIESWGLVWKVGPRGGLSVELPDDYDYE